MSDTDIVQYVHGQCPCGAPAPLFRASGQSGPPLCHRCHQGGGAVIQARDQRGPGAAPPEWVTPVRMNDWGSEYLLRGEPAGFRDGIWSRRNEPDECVIGPGPLDIQWPDGHVETLEVTLDPTSISIQDMGHTYHATSEVPRVTVTAHGAQVSMPLWNLPVKVRRPP